MGVCSSQGQAANVGPFAVGISDGDNCSFYGMEDDCIVKVDGTFSGFKTAQKLDSAENPKGEEGTFKEQYGFKPFGLDVNHTGADKSVIQMYGVKDGHIVHLNTHMLDSNTTAAQSAEELAEELISASKLEVQAVRQQMKDNHELANSIIDQLGYLKNMIDAEASIRQLAGLSGAELTVALSKMPEEELTPALALMAAEQKADLKAAMFEAMSPKDRKDAESKFDNWPKPDHTSAAALQEMSDEEKTEKLGAIFAGGNDDNLLSVLLGMTSEQRHDVNRVLTDALGPAKAKRTDEEEKVAQVCSQRLQVLEEMKPKRRYMTFAVMSPSERRDTMALMSEEQKAKYNKKIEKLQPPYTFKQRYGFIPFAGRVAASNSYFYGFQAGKLVRANPNRAHIPFAQLNLKLSARKTAAAVASMSHQHRQAVLKDMSSTLAAQIYTAIYPLLYDTMTEKRKQQTTRKAHLSRLEIQNEADRSKELRRIEADHWTACSRAIPVKEHPSFKEKYNFVPFGAGQAAEQVVFYGVQIDGVIPEGGEAEDAATDIVKVIIETPDIPTVESSSFYGFE